MYADYKDGAKNQASRTKVKKLVTLEGGKPRHMCSTTFEDLLVIMQSDDDKQLKVVRYSGSKENKASYGKTKVNPSIHLSITLNPLVRIGTCRIGAWLTL